jgi:two-component system, LytTR family, response regulator
MMRVDGNLEETDMSSSALPERPVSDTLKGVSVLIVEDSWHVAKGLKSLLEQIGMNVIGPTATTSHAKQLLTEQQPRLALVDVNLKNETASDLVEVLLGQGVQVIVISGYAQPPVSFRKAAAFLQKPFNGKELIAVMCAAVDRPQ